MRNHRKTSLDRYQAYLMRIWLDDRPGADNLPPVWRFSLEDAHSGARLGFTSLEMMEAYLRELLSGNPKND